MTKRIEARQSLIRFTEYTYPKYRAAKFHERISDELQAVLRGDIDRLMIKMPPRMGKLIADDEPVLTESGWKTHGDLRVGDRVFHPSGKAVNVVAISDPGVADHEIEFSNGDRIACHGRHEWQVWDRLRKRSVVCETQWLVGLTRFGTPRTLWWTHGSKSRGRYQLPLSSAVEFPDAILPLHPYVLGAWLGDGSSTKPAITHAPSDIAVINRIAALGFVVSTTCVHPTTGCHTTYFGGSPNKSGPLWVALLALGVNGNKRIPDAYKASSVSQRLQLLAGLVDTDGHVDKKGRVGVTTASKELADDIFDVATTLGFRPYIVVTQPRTSSSGVVGKKVVYFVGFQPTCQIPTQLARKNISRIARQRRISIKAIRMVDVPRPGKCIQVDADDGMYLVGKSLIPTHNSELGSKRFPAFSLGHRPDLQFISASATAALAEDFGRDVRNLIASQEYQSLFPGVELAPDSQAKHKWHTNKGGIYYSLGIGGSIMGRGADIALIDDVFASWEDAQSAVWLDKVWSWYTGSLYNRLMPGGAIVLIGHRGNERDLQGRLLEQQAAGGDQWRVVEFKAIDDNGRALWPERYPIETLERIKKNTSAPEWNALYQQDPSTDDEAILKSAWWNCWPADKRMPEIVFLMQVWDTAFELHEAADFTACTVWGVFFNTDTGRYEIMLLGRYQERVDFPELRKKAKEYYEAYHHSSIGPVNKVIVEAKATGKPIVQELRRAGIPVNEFEVIRNSRGKEVAKPVKVQAASVVLSSGSVWYPEGAQWADSVISECRQFRANMTHEHDDLADTCAMAWVYLRRTWWLQHEDDRDRGDREQIRLVPRGAARTDDNIWDDDDDDEEAA